MMLETLFPTHAFSALETLFPANATEKISVDTYVSLPAGMTTASVHAATMLDAVVVFIGDAGHAAVGLEFT